MGKVYVTVPVLSQIRGLGPGHGGQDQSPIINSDFGDSSELWPPPRAACCGRKVEIPIRPKAKVKSRPGYRGAQNTVRKHCSHSHAVPLEQIVQKAPGPGYSSPIWTSVHFCWNIANASEPVAAR
ncbi:hypothetical protein PG996_015149 [Apiospora saccharicola]|uniref:Uncharacterized protein n=1 Tax=Apiospora saccharicola TaxID=335842 RepID=A0ABR1TKA8_9PEZI